MVNKKANHALRRQSLGAVQMLASLLLTNEVCASTSPNTVASAPLWQSPLFIGGVVVALGVVGLVTAWALGAFGGSNNVVQPQPQPQPNPAPQPVNTTPLAPASTGLIPNYSFQVPLASTTLSLNAKNLIKAVADGQYDLSTTISYTDQFGVVKVGTPVTGTISLSSSAGATSASEATGVGILIDLNSVSALSVSDKIYISFTEFLNWFVNPAAALFVPKRAVVNGIMQDNALITPAVQATGYKLTLSNRTLQIAYYGSPVAACLSVNGVFSPVPTTEPVLPTQEILSKPGAEFVPYSSLSAPEQLKVSEAIQNLISGSISSQDPVNQSSGQYSFKYTVPGTWQKLLINGQLVGYSTIINGNTLYFTLRELYCLYTISSAALAPTANDVKAVYDELLTKFRILTSAYSDSINVLTNVNDLLSTVKGVAISSGAGKSIVDLFNNDTTPLASILGAAGIDQLAGSDVMKALIKTFMQYIAKKLFILPTRTLQSDGSILTDQNNGYCVSVSANLISANMLINPANTFALPAAALLPANTKMLTGSGSVNDVFGFGVYGFNVPFEVLGPTNQQHINVLLGSNMSIIYDKTLRNATTNVSFSHLNLNGLNVGVKVSFSIPYASRDLTLYLTYGELLAWYAATRVSGQSADFLLVGYRSLQNLNGYSKVVTGGADSFGNQGYSLSFGLAGQIIVNGLTTAPTTDVSSAESLGTSRIGASLSLNPSYS